MARVRPKLAATLGDLGAVAVALWFIAGTAFSDVPAKRLLDAVGAVVILLSVRRIWRRHGDRA